jgi:release factor glutamine methyltransferase
MKVKDIILLGVDAQDVVAHYLGVKRLDLYLDLEREIPNDILDRLQAGEPSAYIIGHVDFFDCRIAVDRRCLIPRQETEQLVAKIKGTGRLLDLCTGSGAIGISLKKRYPEIDVVMADISPEVLDLAEKNAAANNVKVSIVQSDLLDNIEGKFDIIVCNPPYVTEREWEEIATKDFEPRLAFIGGLAFYEKLSQKAGDYMNPGGTLIVEIGSTQGEAVKALFKKQLCRLEKDFAGHDRFLWIFY